MSHTTPESASSVHFRVRLTNAKVEWRALKVVTDILETQCFGQQRQQQAKSKKQYSIKHQKALHFLNFTYVFLWTSDILMLRSVYKCNKIHWRLGLHLITRREFKSPLDPLRYGEGRRMGGRKWKCEGRKGRGWRYYFAHGRCLSGGLMNWQ